MSSGAEGQKCYFLVDRIRANSYLECAIMEKGRTVGSCGV